MPTTDNQTTKAIEWAVERISAASQSGWWIDRISQLSGSTTPAYKTAAPAPKGWGHSERGTPPSGG